MTYRHAVGIRSYVFADLKDLMAKATPLRSGDLLAGVAATTAEERMAAKLALAAKDAIVMHPGPMNRGLEIDSAVADGPQSVILPQVTYGIAVRMAVMAMLAGN